MQKYWRNSKQAKKAKRKMEKIIVPFDFAAYVWYKQSVT